MPTLSIVIPTKDEEVLLPRLLRSIERQSMKSIEVIVADAKSEDRTREIAASFGARVVEGGMPGPGRNRGAEVAKGELIFFFDADVELPHERFLEDAVEDFEARQLGIATADVWPIGGTRYDEFSHNVYNKYVRLWGDKHPHAPGFCILVAKDIHRAISGFDERVLFLEDHDYACRASKVAKFGFLSGTQIHVSTRRQERDGRLSMGVKYVMAELHYLLIGSIRHNGFNYTFGYKDLYGRKEPIV